MNMLTRENTRASGEELVWLGKPAAYRRAQILAAAQHIFAAEGYNSAEVQTIAQRTGIGKATIYKIFRNKHGILQAMMTDTVEHLNVIMLGRLVGVEKPLERFRKGAIDMLQFVEDNRDLCLVLLRDAGLALQQLGKTYKAFQDRMEDLLQPIFETERNEGRFSKMTNRQVLEIAMSLLIGLAYKWLLLQGGEGELVAEGEIALELMMCDLRGRVAVAA